MGEEALQGVGFVCLALDFDHEYPYRGGIAKCVTFVFSGRVGTIVAPPGKNLLGAVEASGGAYHTYLYGL